MKIRVTDDKHPLFGQEFEGDCFYYDVYHTGNSPDLFVMVTPNGKEQILSTQIDEGHYWEQRRQEHIKNLGADIGDTVMITRSGGGSFNSGFDLELPHKITAINSSGYVTFDNGAAKCFRPDVVKVEEMRCHNA